MTFARSSIELPFRPSEMLKNGKERALEIVVRENHWTILHFLCK